MGFSSASLFPARKYEVVTLGGTRGIDYLTRRSMVGRFAEVCKRRGLKINEGKSKVVVLKGEERL